MSNFIYRMEVLNYIIQTEQLKPQTQVIFIKVLTNIYDYK